jgi:cysteine synthase
MRAKFQTPLLEVLPGLLAKFECDNPGGSHKVRAARYIVNKAMERGEIIPGQTTVIEKTGGNFGFGLAIVCNEFKIPVELAVGLSFSPIKRHCLELFGAKLIGIDMLNAGSTPREVIEWHLAHARTFGKHYYYSDQFNNPDSVAAHELETGPEIIEQLRAWPHLKSLTLVKCAGTGASLTGIARSLIAAGYLTEIVLVEPLGCDSQSGIFTDHKFEGMAVGVKPPFVDWKLVSEVKRVGYEQMLICQREFARSHGYFVGNTAAACLLVAQELAPKTDETHKVLTLLYDHGLWYLKTQ